MLRLFFLSAILLFSSNACQFASLTANLYDTPSGAVLFQDDFSDPSSGWEIFNQIETGTMDYFDSLFRIHVLGEYQMLSSFPGLFFSDVQVEADMIKVVGKSDDMFGLVCRAMDKQNYYFFVISSDGYYGIGKVIAGVQSILGTQGMMPSEIISQGKNKNHLRADCIGDKLILSVNGQELQSVIDNDIDHGDVGILAGTLQDPENVVLCDNFQAINP